MSDPSCPRLRPILFSKVVGLGVGVDRLAVIHCGAACAAWSAQAGLAAANSARTARGTTAMMARVAVAACRTATPTRAAASSACVAVRLESARHAWPSDLGAQASSADATLSRSARVSVARPASTTLVASRTAAPARAAAGPRRRRRLRGIYWWHRRYERHGRDVLNGRGGCAVCFIPEWCGRHGRRHGWRNGVCFRCRRH